MNAIDALVQVCPPPDDPPPGVDWASVEEGLGMRLPADYKRLADAYGPGTFADFIHIFHPHGPTEYVDLTGPEPARARAQLQVDYDGGTHPVPYEPRHLFNMGGTDNGEDLFWITDPHGAPDTWRIAVNEARGPEWFTFDGTLSAFLASVLGGETAVPQFPGGLLSHSTDFVPYGPTLWVPPPQRPARPPVDTESIREWGRAHGYDVPPRGRVPLVVREAWERAHPL
ncbi:Lsr2 family DNA-binding protein [Streptomyces sp. NPDC001700]